MTFMTVYTQKHERIRLEARIWGFKLYADDAQVYATGRTHKKTKEVANSPVVW